MQVTGTYVEMVMTPVVAFCNKTVDGISKKIDESDSQTLKYMKTVGKATVDATN